MIASVVYTLCAATALLCFFMLWRHRSVRLLLWSALCFGGLAITNLLLVLEKLTGLGEGSLQTTRLAIALVSVSLLLIGLIWEDH